MTNVKSKLSDIYNYKYYLGYFSQFIIISKETYLTYVNSLVLNCKYFKLKVAICDI